MCSSGLQGYTDYSTLLYCGLSIARFPHLHLRSIPQHERCWANNYNAGFQQDMEKEEPEQHQSVGLNFTLWTSPVAPGPSCSVTRWPYTSYRLRWYQVPTLCILLVKLGQAFRQIMWGGEQSPTEWIDSCMLLMPSLSLRRSQDATLRTSPLSSWSFWPLLFLSLLLQFSLQAHVLAKRDFLGRPEVGV